MILYNAHLQLTSGEVILEKEQKIKVGQVWQTNSGNLVYIIQLPSEQYFQQENEDCEKEFKFLWYDEVDDDMNIADLDDRLAILTSHDLDYWLNNVKDYQPVFIRTREMRKE